MRQAEVAQIIAKQYKELPEAKLEELKAQYQESLIKYQEELIQKGFKNPPEEPFLPFQLFTQMMMKRDGLRYAIPVPYRYLQKWDEMTVKQKAPFVRKFEKMKREFAAWEKLKSNKV